MKETKLIIPFLLIFGLNFKSVLSNCIWYGQCGHSEHGVDGRYNCKYTGPAKQQTNETFIKIFKELCPHMYKESEDIRTCCDYDQLITFYDNLSVPRQLLSRCPSCFKNFKAFLCDFTCSPIQNEFMLITKEDEYHPTENETKIEIIELTYHITNYSVNALYKSCK